MVAAGRLAPGKGMRVLLDAWCLTRSRLQLEILGDGPLRANLEAAAPPGVRFVGQVSPDAVTARLLQARALVFPSEWLEPFGMVLVQAMAAGAAVVGADVADTADVVRPIRPGLLVTSGQPPALADALGLLVDDALVDQAGAAGRRRYQATFTPQANLPFLEAAYQMAIRHRGKSH